MGEMDWGAVVAAALAARLVLELAVRSRTVGERLATFAICLVPAAMLGHALARIGPDTLAAKPHLYFMQSGGLALAFVLPALWLVRSREGTAPRRVAIDSAVFLAAYLAMGAIFWALSWQFR